MSNSDHAQPPTKRLGLVFIDRFADWEYGLLAASAVEWFGAQVVALSPGGAPVTSCSGFTLSAHRGTDPGANEDLDAVAVIGSDVWTSDAAPDISALLTSVRDRVGIVGGICAGTLTLARAGLFEGVGHTSNGRDWIREKAPGYAGAAGYRDVPHAVADDNVVSAPGSAPGTFAHQYLLTLFPDRPNELAQMRAMFAKEYGG